MATLADLEQTVSDISTATDTVAAEVIALQGQIVPGISSADADTVNAQLAGIAARLKSIGTPATPAGNVAPTAPTPPAAS